MGACYYLKKTRQDNPRANDILNQLYTDFKLNNGTQAMKIVAKAIEVGKERLYI